MEEKKICKCINKYGKYSSNSNILCMSFLTNLDLTVLLFISLVSTPLGIIKLFITSLFMICSGFILLFLNSLKM